MTLSFWEEFIVNAAISFLTTLKAKIQNPTQLAALNGALTFLNDLLAGQVSISQVRRIDLNK